MIAPAMILGHSLKDALVLGKKEGGPFCGENEALKEAHCGEGSTYKHCTLCPDFMAIAQRVRLRLKSSNLPEAT